MNGKWRHWLVLLAAVALLFVPGSAAAEEEHAWVHTQTVYRINGGHWEPLPADLYVRQKWPNNADVSAVFDDHRIEIKVTSSGRNPNQPDRNMHVIYTYTPPPQVIYSERTIEISIHQELISNETGGLFTTISASADIAQSWPMAVAEPHPLAGETSVAFGQSTREISGLLETSGRFVLARESWRAGRPGREQRIQLAFGTHSTMGGTIQLQYWYEWKSVPDATRSYSAW